MPEGPEVRQQALQLNDLLCGSELLAIRIRKCSRYYKDGLKDLLKISQNVSLTYAELSSPFIFEKVDSKGKKIIFEMSNNIWFVNSLCMTGHWSLVKSDYSGIVFECRNIIQGEFKVYFDDMRHFGSFEIVDCPKDLRERLSDIGPDLLQERLNIESFKSRLLKGSGTRQICQVLMDQSCVSGIGNYLKAEILYDARIRPDRIINSLSGEEWTRVYESSYTIIKRAFDSQGNTIKNYYDLTGKRGEFRCVIYDCRKDPLGNPIRTDIFKDKRTTHWVPDVQV